MSSSSESDFENNSFETDESEEFPSENELSDSLRERFSNILPYQFEAEKETNADDTLDNVGSVPVNNILNQETNTHEVDHVTRNKWCFCNECRKEEREIDCLCCGDMTAISESRKINGAFATNVVKKREKLIVCVAVM